MGTLVTPRRSVVLVLLIAALSVGLALGTPHGLGTASAAGSNSAVGNCVKAFNYADPHQGWLYATSEAFNGCWYVRATIYNRAILQGSGFEDSDCAGTDTWGTNFGEVYTGVSVYQDASLWQAPCSQHQAQPYSGWWPSSNGAIYFRCSLRACRG